MFDSSYYINSISYVLCHIYIIYMVILFSRFLSGCSGICELIKSAFSNNYVYLCIIRILIWTLSA